MMGYVTIVAMLALIEFVAFGALVGRTRGRTGVAAPAISGNEEFERYFRVHQNTLEQLVIFLPALFAFAHFNSAEVAAGVGLLFIIGRVVYLRAYVKDPGSRTLGFLMGMLANIVLVFGAIIGAVRSL